MPALPGPERTDHLVVSLPGGRVLVAGGLTADPSVPVETAFALADAYVFDSRTCRWLTAPPMGVSRSNAAVTVLHDGTVLVAGGLHGVRDDAQVNDRRVEVFLPPPGPRRTATDGY